MIVPFVKNIVNIIVCYIKLNVIVFQPQLQ